MPFDGEIRSGFVGLDDMLLDMVEFSFAGGSRWAQRAVEVGDSHCLIGAAQYVARETGCESDRTIQYLSEAITKWQRRHRLIPSQNCDIDNVVGFNDAKGRRFAEIVAVIREARELAMVDEYVRRMERGIAPANVFLTAPAVSGG